MATSLKQDQDFLNECIGTSLLESAIEWMKANLSPEDIFTEKELLAWASNYDPEDVFTTNNLESWAESNGYIKE